jgi:predicted RNA-binding Zn ribbon-like protein
MDQWVFLGGSLCLDFVNTLLNRWRDEPTETLSTPVETGQWAQAVGLVSQPLVVSFDECEEVRRFREAMYSLLRDADRPGVAAEVDTVNHYAAVAKRAELAVDPQNGDIVLIPYTIASVSDLLGALAEDFLGLVREHGVAQVKECGHQRCGLVFLDASRGQRRRWCSMKRCGNRMKAQRHARKEGAPARAVSA